VRVKAESCIAGIRVLIILKNTNTHATHAMEGHIRDDVVHSSVMTTTSNIHLIKLKVQAHFQRVAAPD